MILDSIFQFAQNPNQILPTTLWITIAFKAARFIRFPRTDNVAGLNDQALDALVTQRVTENVSQTLIQEIGLG